MRASRWWTDLPNLRTHFARPASRWIFGGLIALLLVGGGRAWALPEDSCIKDEKCKGHYTQAVKLYKDEDFDTALSEFQAAYSARAMPLLLVNIGRTLQKMGRPKDALGYYERFLAAESRIDADTKKRVDEYIVQVKALIGTEPDKPLPNANVEPPKPIVPALPPPPPPPPPGRNLVIAGAVVVGVGVAGIITGIALGAVSQGYFGNFQTSNDEFDKLSYKSSAQTFNQGAVIAGILGAAVGVTGGVMIGIGKRQMNNFRRAEATKQANKPQARLLPWAGTSGAGLVLQGGF